MSKHIQLHIPKPCHENWNGMTQAEKGRFCNSCQKRVVDFTGMSDEQILAFFRRPTNSSTCGRFMKDQLDRAIKVSKKRLPWVKYFFQIALPALLASTKATAQGKVVLTGDTIIVSTPQKIVLGNAIIEETKKEIWGKIIDDNGEGIPYATVVIKGTTIATTTDSVGDFSIKYRGKEDNCVLVTSCIGFLPKESIVTFNKKEEDIIISLSLNIVYDDIVMGMIMPEIVDISFPQIIDEDTENTEKKISDKNFLFDQLPASGIYPNPVKKNSIVSVKMDDEENGNYLFQLLTINGQVVLNRELWIDENNKVVKMSIPSLTAGTYFLRKRNKQSGKSYTEKIIVE